MSQSQNRSNLMIQRVLPLLMISLFARVAGAEDASRERWTSISPVETEFVYEAHVTIGEVVEVGETASGIRRYIPITGGRFEGPRLKGTVLPGGADWQTERSDGATQLDALYSMRCDDGTVIIVRNRGILSQGGTYLMTTPTFVVPEGPHAWLDDFLHVGTVSGSDEPNTVVIRVFRAL